MDQGFCDGIFGTKKGLLLHGFNPHCRFVLISSSSVSACDISSRAIAVLIRGWIFLHHRDPLPGFCTGDQSGWTVDAQHRLEGLV
jgi:hypothetical protein